MSRTGRKVGVYRWGFEPLEPRALPSGAGKPPAAVTLHLAPAVAPAGDDVALTGPRVALTGHAAPGAGVVLLRETGAGPMQAVGRSRANARGEFRFAVLCATGTTTLAAESAGGGAVLSLTRANQAVAWNSAALEAVRTARLQAPDAARALAIVQLAVFEAVNAVDPRYAPYGPTPAAPRGASADAAAAGAASAALAALFPGQAGVIAAERKVALAAVPGGPAKARGLRFGEAVAARVVASRAHDGSGDVVAYRPAPGPGVWVPTPPDFSPPVDPQFGGVTPFVLASGAQFTPPPPPPITSARYADELAQVEALGGDTSTLRTADQTAAARFWSDLVGTYTPPGHWNQVAEDAAVSRGMDLADSARTFALLDLALADAAIEAWGVKYTDNTWRPVTAIRNGDGGVNPLVSADPAWTPLWSTPPFPSYVSGHSTFSAAAAAVLDSVFGADTPFTDRGDPAVGLAPRHFTGFDQAAAEAGMSRIYGGIHFSSDNTAGLALGEQVGQYVVGHALAPLGPTRS